MDWGFLRTQCWGRNLDLKGRKTDREENCIMMNFTACILHRILLRVKLSLCFNWAPCHEGVLGEWRYSSTHSSTSALDGGEWLASRLGRFTPRERAPGTHWTGGWVEPRAVLDAVVKRKIPSPRRESNTVIKSRRMRWAEHVAGIGEGWGVYRVLFGRPEGKRPLGRPRRRWEDNIKMDLREIGIDRANWIRLAHDRVQWWAFVNMVMILRVP
jgi:hypothetical protein